MYYYIVDPQKLTQKNYERIQNRLYSSLSSFRISGETVRVSGLRTIPQLTDIAFSHGAKTIVAVGSDETLHDVINALRGRDAIIGFIPLFQTELSEVLGLANIESACRVLAGRRITQLDLGLASSFYFLSKLTFGISPSNDIKSLLNFGAIRKFFDLTTFEVSFSADSYRGTLNVVGGVIINARSDESKSVLANPSDGILDVVLLPKLNKLTIIKERKNIAQGLFEKVPGSGLLHLKKIHIQSPAGLPLRVGNRVVAKTPATIEIVPRALKIIVGKDRMF